MSADLPPPGRTAVVVVALVLAVVVLAAVVARAGDAAAAQLRLVGAPTFSAEAASRCTDAVTVTPVGSGTVSSVQVNGLAAGCGGLPLEVQVWDTAAAPGTPPAFAGTTTVPVGATAVTVPGTGAVTPSTAQRALVVVARWPLPTAWAPPPAAGCTVTGVVRWVGGTRVVDPPSGQTCAATLLTVSTPGTTQPHADLSLRVTTTSAAAVVWSVTLNFAEPVYPLRPRSVDGGAVARVTSRCADLPVVRLAGETSSTDTVTAGQPRDLLVRAHQSGVGGADLVC